MDIRGLIGNAYGVRVAEREYPDATSAGTTPAVVARRNGARLALIIINTSANTVAIAPSPSVTTTRGIQVPPNGGSVTLQWRDDLTLPAAEWWIVASAAASTIYVLSVEIQPEGSM